MIENLPKNKKKIKNFAEEIQIIKCSNANYETIHLYDNAKKTQWFYDLSTHLDDKLSLIQIKFKCWNDNKFSFMHSQI